jgi:hypothetical protein
VGIRRITSHSLQAVAEAALIALLVVGLMAGTAFAGKGGGNQSTGGSSSLAVVMVTDANGNGSANWGDRVTFAVSTTATAKPWVAVNCSQGGSWVYSASAGFFPAYAWEPNYTLAATGWTSGAADCTAKLYYVSSNGRNKTLTTMSFHVDG